MKKYQSFELKIVFFSDDDIVTISKTDNVEEMPDFPENFG